MMAKSKKAPRRLFISFSGGETSAYMLWLIITFFRDRYDEMVCGFANTSQECEETLVFVKRVAEHFGIKVVWLQAVIHHEDGVGTAHQIVNFETAKRTGEIFEEMIKFYGIPNPSYLHCTRELKAQTMLSYIRSLGWEKGTYHIAQGIRADEAWRVDAKADEKGWVYPLCHWEMTDKIDVNNFWEDQPFRLELRTHEGNCKTCFKKSDKKLMRLMHEHPERFDFTREMEAKYGTIKVPDGTPRVFYRGNRSTDDLAAQYLELFAHGWTPDVFDELDDDKSSGCTSSCEAFVEAA